MITQARSAWPVLLLGSLVLAGACAVSHPPTNHDVDSSGGGSAEGAVGAGGSSATGMACSGNAAVFVSAVDAMETLASAMSAEVQTACMHIAIAGGSDASAWAGKEGDDLTAAACNAASAAMDATLVGSNITLTATVTPGACQSSFSADGACNAQCSGAASCSPAELQPICTLLSGGCTGSCSGTCQTGASIKDVMGVCSGICSGMCSVSFSSPSCAGHFTAPSCPIEPSCQADCNAEAQASALCTPPEVTIMVNGMMTAQVAALVAALEADVPILFQDGIERAPDLTTDLKALATASSSFEADAVGCAQAQVSGLAPATSSIKVSMIASTIVSTKAGASGF